MIDSMQALESWMQRTSANGWIWYLKYVAANDTYAKPNVHQGGPYLSKELLRTAFPELCLRADSVVNPDLMLPARVASHRLEQDVRVVWYNSKRIERRPDGRDEARITQWGGREHPLVEENATGSLIAFAFRQESPDRDSDACELWIAANDDEADTLVGYAGPLDPGGGLVFSPATGSVVGTVPQGVRPCALSTSEIDAAWLEQLPSGDAILDLVLARQPKLRALAVDARLMKRRECEFELFRSIENHVALPRVREGFSSVEDFVRFAHSVTNRRKSRAGKSLELQVKQIFDEESVQYSWTKATEGKRTPDFVFPSIEHYRDHSFPTAKLRMLAAKTTCKDRWRQVLNEAARIPVKHLLTLQEGVSESQYLEMKSEGVCLVVPRSLHGKYPDAVQAELLELEKFIGDVQAR